MKAKEGGLIRCRQCGKESFLLKEPLYEGFARVGETFRCASCGAPAAPDEAASPGGEKPRVFSAADRPAPVAVFKGDEPPRFCRRCVDYVVNPFRQWCARRQCDVEATDTCADFQPAEEDANRDG